MAYTEIHPITKTLSKAIDYGKNDKFKNIKDDVNDAISYIEKDKDGNEKIYKTITSTLHCSAENATQFFENMRKIHTQGKKKIGKNLAYHVIQSFEEQVSPEIANEIGKKLAEELYGEYQCVISTHTNTDHIHNHIIFNAWSLTGKKFNDCLDSIKQLRKVSDKLCEEYNLSVMNHTKDMKLIKWKDEKGITHFYEPTKRKNAIREGKFSNANDYRNTESYNVGENVKITNREVIINDIEKLIPYSKSYEDLLDKLKDIGYEIKDKKQNGEWRVHVSFKAPTQNSFSRDYKLGNNEEYTREKIIQRIESNLKEITNIDGNKNDYNIETYEDQAYAYGKINIEEINESYRKRKKGNSYEQVNRSSIEKDIIIDTKKLNREVDSAYKDAVRFKIEKQDITGSARTKYLINRINGNLKTLQFVENKNIQSFEQINSIVSMLYDKRDIVKNELAQISKMLKIANKNVAIINNYNELKRKVHDELNSSEYDEFEIQEDKAMLHTYENILKQANLIELRQQELFKDKYKKFEQSFKGLSNGLEKINNQLIEYDRCVYNLNLVDKNNRQKYTEEVEAYYNIKQEKMEKEKSNKENER